MLITEDGRRRKRSRSRKRGRRADRRRSCVGVVSVLLLIAGGFYGSRSYQRHLKDEQGGMAEERTPPKVSLGAYDYKGWHSLLAENRVSAEYEEGLTAFAFDSGSYILDEGQGNVAYSPLSAYHALALLGCGAEGGTEEEILALLRADDRESIAEGCQKLCRYFYYSEQWSQVQNETSGDTIGGDRVTLGNGLWITDQVKISQEYQELAYERFFAPSLSVDLESPETGKRIGEWVARKTGGRIDAPFFSDPDVRMILVDTLYFYGGWQDPFREIDTKKDGFTPESGEEVSCLYLTKTVEHGAFRKEDGFTVSYLETADSRVFFCLPDKGKTPEDILSAPDLFRYAMDPEQGKWYTGEVIWKIPRASFKSRIDMRAFLADRGLQKIFERPAEFGRISNDPLWISDMAQETFISIEESGVEGAAYTVTESAAAIEEEEDPPTRVEMILDRPFLFGIRTDGGIWLFLGVYRDPAIG